MTGERRPKWKRVVVTEEADTEDDDDYEKDHKAVAAPDPPAVAPPPQPAELPPPPKPKRKMSEAQLANLAKGRERAKAERLKLSEKRDLEIKISQEKREARDQELEELRSL
jgi:hypothetical protein